jgi:hypothetical protein
MTLGGVKIRDVLQKHPRLFDFIMNKLIIYSLVYNIIILLVLIILIITG